MVGRIRAAVLAVICGFVVILWLQSVATAQSGPRYLYIEGLGNDPMVVGREYQVGFHAGVDMVFETDQEILAHGQSCTPNDEALLCPQGAYTATVLAGFASNSIYASFEIYEETEEGRRRLEFLAAPLVKEDSVTPYRVKVVSLRKGSVLIDISIINTTDEVYQGEVTINLYTPEGRKDPISLGVNIAPSEIEVYRAEIPMSKYGMHVLIFQVDGKIYYPLGSDIFYPYREVFLPSIMN